MSSVGRQGPALCRHLGEPGVLIHGQNSRYSSANSALQLPPLQSGNINSYSSELVGGENKSM